MGAPDPAAREPGFSYTALWARIGRPVDQALVATGVVSPGAVATLAEAERALLAAEIAPWLEELEALRRQTLDTVDRRARWMVPLAGIGTAIALLAGGWGVASATLFGLLAALGGWFIAIGRRAERYQAAVKRGFGDTVTTRMPGLTHVVEPETDLAQVRDWWLFPELQSARTLDRFEGDLQGRSVSLSEMAIAYAPGRRARSAARSSMPDAVLHVAAIEAAWPAGDGTVLALTPSDALPVAATGDAVFDAAYVLRCAGDSGRVLTPELRASILAMDRIELPGRPFLSIRPGRVAVLFPLDLNHLAFHAPPYWIPIDADALLARFASDLAHRSALIRMVLELPAPAASPT